MPAARRPPLLACAVAFAGGIGAAAAAGPLAAAPAPFAALAAFFALFARSRPAAALLVFAALGAGRGACDTAVHRRSVSSIDPDLLVAPRWHRGVVRGPASARPGGYEVPLDGEGGRWLLSARGDAPPPLPGDRVEVYGRLARGPRYLTWGASDPEMRLRARGAVALLVAGADRVRVLGGGASPWRAAARAQRRLVEQIARRGGDPAGSAVVRALVAGDRAAVDEATAGALRRAGVAHLLAVSGLHLAVVGLLVFAAVRRLWAAIGPLAIRLEPQAAAAAVALAGSVAYAAVAGARPSAMRAVWVVGVILVGRARWLRPRLPAALGVAALALLARRPALLWDPSFQMSFGAALVLTLAFAGRRRRRGWRQWVTTPLAVSAWALAATAPTAAALFFEVAPAGLVANLVAVPAVELAVLPLSLLGAALCQLSPALGGPLLDVAIAGAGLLVRGAEALGAAIGPVAVPPPGPLELCGFAAALGAALLAARRGGRGRALAAIAAALLAAAALASLEARPAAGGLRVAFLDVGQGDAAVVELPGGAVWLIDGGGRPFSGGERDRRGGETPGRESLLRYLRHRRIDHIDVAVLSHPHPDHYLGLGALLGEVPIDRLWLAAPHPAQRLPPRLRALLRAFRVFGTRVEAPPLDAPTSSGGASIRVLYPAYRGARAAADPVSSVNDNSLVVRFDYAGRRVLFLGDLEAEGERLLVGRVGAAALRADVVKVPHHGSPTSSTPALVAAARPALAVVSCGRGNRFDFPDPAVLERWRGAGAALARTDLDGAVRVTVDAAGRVAVERYAAGSASSAAISAPMARARSTSEPGSDTAPTTGWPPPP